jgi:hypothetical protein
MYSEKKFFWNFRETEVEMQSGLNWHVMGLQWWLLWWGWRIFGFRKTRNFLTGSLFREGLIRRKSSFSRLDIIQMHLKKRGNYLYHLISQARFWIWTRGFICVFYMNVRINNCIFPQQNFYSNGDATCLCEARHYSLSVQKNCSLKIVNRLYVWLVKLLLACWL